MSIVIIDTLKSIWNNDSENDYSVINPVNDLYGVYIFRDKNNGDVFYVGEARDQNLKTRVTQNFTEKNTGGTFKNNYIEKNKCTFNDFKLFIEDKQIIFIATEKNMTARALESILILVLKPQYNKDT